MDAVTDSGGRVTRALRKRIESIDFDSSSRPGTPVQSKLTASTNSPLKPRITRRNSTSGVGTPVKTPGKRGGTVATISEAVQDTATPPRRTTRRRSVSSSIDDEGGTPQQFGAKVPNFVTLIEEEDSVRVTRSKSKSPLEIKPGKQAVSPRQGGTRRSLRNLKDEIVKDKSDEENESNIKDTDSISSTNKKSPQKKTAESSIKPSKMEKDVNANGLDAANQQSPNKLPSVLKKDDGNDTNNTDSKSDVCEALEPLAGGTTNDAPSTLSDTPITKNELVDDHNDFNLHVTQSPGDTPVDVNTNDDVDDVPEVGSNEVTETICDTPSPHKRKSSLKTQPYDSDAVTPQNVRKISVGNSVKAVAFNSQTSDEECEKSIYPKTPATSKSKSFIELDLDTSFRGGCEDSVVVVDDASDTEIPETQLVDSEVEVETDNYTGINDNDDAILVDESTGDEMRTPNKTVAEKSQNDVENFKENSIKKNTESKEKGSPILKKRKTLSPHKEPNSLNNDQISSTSRYVEMEKEESSFKPDNESLIDPSAENPKSLPTRIESISLENNQVSPVEKAELVNKSVRKSSTEIRKSLSADKESVSVKNAQMSPSVKEIDGTSSKSVNESSSTSPVVEKRKSLLDSLNNDETYSTSAHVKMQEEKDNVSTLVESSAVEKRKTLSPHKEGEPGKTSSPPPLKWCNSSVTFKCNTKLDTIENKKQDVDTQHKKAGPKSAEKPKKNKKLFLKRGEWKSDEDNSSEDDEFEEDEEEEETELALEDEPYRRKHEFHDDEAMEVDDYESGDSMDSEERREMLENEIPVDAESIGSHTTDGEDDEHGDEEESNDSFIVSDNDDDVENNHMENDGSSTDSDDEDEEDSVCNNKREKRKSFKRIQPMHESSSSSDELEEIVDTKLIKDDNDLATVDGTVGIEDNTNTLNSTKLSDSALRLQSQDDNESDQSNEEEQDEIVANRSRKEILRKLNQSDRFNKSVRDLNPDVDVSPEVEGQIREREPSLSRVCREEDSDDSESLISKSTEEKSNKSLVETSVSISNNKKPALKSEDVEGDSDVEATAASTDDSEPEMEINGSKQSESHDREEIPSTSEDNDDGSDDKDKENESECRNLSKAKHRRGLSVSFGHMKCKKKDSLQKRVLQRSFTIGVRINGGEIGTAVIENKTPETTTDASAASATPSSSNEDNDDHVLSSEDIRYLENIKHMPLGNPLVRTRRQSLALPTNPDMEIGSSSLGIAAPANKPKRKSLAILSGNEFNPSQSFVDSIELRKADYNPQSSKRKRLSKSFCGTLDGLDHSIIDLDAQHLHKRSKLAINDSSFVDSLENLSATSKSTGTKVKPQSSTPHEKVSKNRNDSSILRILNKCDEILEAANRAKLEAKINFKKSKVKLSKKSKKKIQRQSLSPESKQDKLFAPITKEFKSKEKNKKTAAVTRALKASADIIIGKQRKTFEEEEENEEERNVFEDLPPAHFVESIAESQPTVVKSKKNKKNPLAEHAEFRNYATSAGNVIETQPTPEKKKKPKIIHLPTGKVCVEHITPVKRSILTCNGMEFRESPATPCDGLGFNIQFSALDTPQFAAAHARDRKRKRHIAEEAKMKTVPKPQWTQSGLFMEEEIPLARASQLSRILKKHNTTGGQQNQFNFKQSALMRNDVKRCSNRENLMLREHRRNHIN